MDPIPDSDDRLNEYTLEILLRNTDGVDVVICMLEEFPHRRVYQAVTSPVRYETFASAAADFCHLYKMYVFSSACTKLYRREHIRIHFDENLRHMEDIIFNLEFLPTCKGIRIIPDVLYQYRREQVMTLSKRFWADTLQIHNRETQLLLKLFPESEKIQKMVLERYGLNIMHWICAVTQIKSIGKPEKLMLLELHLNTALDISKLAQISFKGIDGLMWRVVRSGRPNLIFVAFHVYSRIQVKNKSLQEM